ncbi:MAG: hypothetical protein EHM58_16265 [Ignavibacteriae bacterium]|nr:MAG: hypothetical protein EHM58_16265 [Ignavibacteriota bacterium]
MNKTLWLKIAAGISFFMAVIQSYISLSPAAAAYFQAPPSLLENRLSLFLYGEGAALVLVVFGLYALSGAKVIRHLPLLCFVLIVVSSIFLMRGLFIIITVLKIAGVLQGEVLTQGVVSHFVFLAAGIAFTLGTILNWKKMRIRN